MSNVSIGGFINTDWSYPYLDNTDIFHPSLFKYNKLTKESKTFILNDNTSNKGFFLNDSSNNPLHGFTIFSNDTSNYNTILDDGKDKYISTQSTYGTLEGIRVYDNSGNYVRYRDSSNAEYYLTIDISSNFIKNLDNDVYQDNNNDVYQDNDNGSYTLNNQTITIYGISAATNNKFYDLYAPDNSGNSILVYYYKNNFNNPYSINVDPKYFNINTTSIYNKKKTNCNDISLKADGIAQESLYYNGLILPSINLNNSSSNINITSPLIASIVSDWSGFIDFGSGDIPDDVSLPNNLKDRRNVWSNKNTSISCPIQNGYVTYSDLYLNTSISYQYLLNKKFVITSGYILLNFSINVSGQIV